MTHKCLEKDPEKRWQNAEDVKTELEWIRDTLRRPGRPASNRLRMLGNGVHILQAAYAFRTLATRLAARSAGAAALVRLMNLSSPVASASLQKHNNERQ